MVGALAFTLVYFLFLFMNKIGEREQLLWQTIGLIIRALTHHDLYSCLLILLGLSRDSDLLQYLGRLVLV